MNNDYQDTYKYKSALNLKEMHLKLTAALAKSIATSMTVLDIDKKYNKPNELAGIFNGSRINASLEPAFILKILPDKSYEFSFIARSKVDSRPDNTSHKIEIALKDLQKNNAISAVTGSSRKFLNNADKISLGGIY